MCRGPSVVQKRLGDLFSFSLETTVRSPMPCWSRMQSFPPCLPASRPHIGPTPMPRCPPFPPTAQLLQLPWSREMEGCWDTNLLPTFSFCFKRTCPEDTTTPRSRTVSLTEQEQKPVLCFQSKCQYCWFSTSTVRPGQMFSVPRRPTTSLAGVRGWGRGVRGDWGSSGSICKASVSLQKGTLSGLVGLVFPGECSSSLSYYPVRVNFQLVKIAFSMDFMSMRRISYFFPTKYSLPCS